MVHIMMVERILHIHTFEVKMVVIQEPPILDPVSYSEISLARKSLATPATTCETFHEPKNLCFRYACLFTDAGDEIGEDGMRESPVDIDCGCSYAVVLLRTRKSVCLVASMALIVIPTKVNLEFLNCRSRKGTHGDEDTQDSQ